MYVALVTFANSLSMSLIESNDYNQDKDLLEEEQEEETTEEITTNKVF
jgi:hypothetical protein